MGSVRKGHQGKLYFRFLALFIFILFIIFYIFYNAYQMNIYHRLLVEASLRVQIEITTAHLWFEEIISGDKNEDMMKDVWSHLERAEWYARVIIEGGEDKEHLYVPLDDPDLKRKITRALKTIATFRNNTKIRQEAPGLAGTGSDIDQEYDAVYQRMMNEVNGVHMILQEKINERHVHFLSTGLILILIIIIIVIIGFLKFRSFERDRLKSKQHQIESEKKLSEREVIFRGLFENISSGVAIYEAVDDGENFKFKNINQSSERIEGMQREDIIGKLVTDVFPGVIEFGLFDVFARVYKTGEPAEHPISLYKDDNIIGWRENYIFKIPSGEIVAVYNDVTEQKKAEQALRHLTEQLEEKNKELEQIVYVTSHDLRSPLVNIQGFSNELRESLREMRSQIQSSALDDTALEILKRILDEDMGESIRYILSSTTKIDSLLTGLLKFSRLGRSTLSMHTVDMNTMVSDILETMEYRIKKESIMVEREELPTCFGDKNLLNQIFSNILDNSIKFIDPKKAGIIRITGKVEGQNAIYYIEDNGIGIESEYHSKVFEIFHQLNPNATEGVGLGMTIVRKILDMHNGEIRLASVPGLGSKISISLPISDWRE